MINITFTVSCSQYKNHHQLSWKGPWVDAEEKQQVTVVVDDDDVTAVQENKIKAILLEVVMGIFT